MNSIRDSVNLYDQLENILHNAMLLGLHKEKRFLEKLFSLDKIRFDYIPPSKKTEGDFFKLLDLYSEKYKENFDLGFYFSRGKVEPYFKVLYPEITISNSKGDHHKITDLIVIHTFRSSHNGLVFGDLKGGRLTKEEVEASCGYQQSHLGTLTNWIDHPMEISSFCTGGATEVSRMMAEFAYEIDIDRFELFLFCIDSMLTWESLEGVPYFRMTSISYSGQSKITSSSRVFEHTIISWILDNEIPLDVDFYISDGRYKVKPNHKANQFIKNLIIENERSSELVYTDSSGNYYKYNANLTLLTVELGSSAKNHYTIFRGRKIYPKTIRKDKRKTFQSCSLEECIVYPKTLENVLRKLEDKIHKEAVVSSTARTFVNS